MRAFLGLSLDAKTKLAIETWRNKALPEFNAPVPAANFHITLAFLGKVIPKHLDALTSQIEAMPEINEFPVSLNHMGYWAKPKACWLGCDNTHKAHFQLATSLTKSAKNSGIVMPKQDYIAHLTLARKCILNPPAPLIPADFSWQAKEFHLFESVSSAHGMAYHIRQSWPLKKTFSFNRE